MKEIYSFTVELDKEVEKPVVKKRKNKEGKIEEYKEMVTAKEPVPIKIIIKEPNRKELEEADIEYSIEMSKCIKRGILTKAMLAKKYSDSGGLLSEEDAQTLTRLYAQLGDDQNKYSRLSSKPKNNDVEKKRMQALLGKMAEKRREIVDMETSYSSLFNHTADSKAQNKVLLWYLVHLSYYQKQEEDEIIPFFTGESSEDKIDEYYELDEGGDDIFDLAKDKITTMLSFWYFSTNASKEDFESLEKDIEEGSV
jgi:hypothetical protein